jgi:hypothetical protein
LAGLSGVRDAVSVEDVALEEAARYFWYATKFGWTPDQVDNMPGWLTDRIATVAAVSDEVEADKQKAKQAG